MKKFFLKAGLFLALCMPSLLILNTMYINTNHWKAENYVWKFNSVPNGIQLANFGSSHGTYDFFYEGFSQYKTFNFALASQRYFWDYGILQQYMSHFDSEAVVLLPISYFGITSRPESYDSLRPRYYRFLEKQYFDRWNVIDAIRYAHLPILSAGKNSMKCFDDVPPESIDFFSSRTAFLEAEELREYCQKKHESWTNPEHEKGEEGYKQNLEEVCLLVDFCLKNGLKPVLITTPITTVLNDIYAQQSPNFFSTFYRFIGDVLARFPDVPYFDYSHDQEFSQNVELFADGDHLNVYGARKFTARVVADLQAAGLLQ